MSGKRTITADAVRRIAPGEIIWDNRVQGFGVRRQASDACTYLVKTRARGKSRWFTIGRHGAPWTPDTARKEALRILGDIARGEDLVAVRNQSKATVTVSELCDTYLAAAVSGQLRTKFGAAKKPSTIATDRGRIERHIKPLLGTMSVRDVTSADVRRFLADVASGKTAADVRTKRYGRAIVEGGAGTATRTVGLLGGIFSYACENGYRADGDNPVHGVKRYPDRREDRFLTEAELGRLGAALAAAEADGENPTAIAGIRLLMLTGCRKSEILHLRWDEVDLENSCLRLADSKTGEKTIYLGQPAVDLLAALPRTAGNPHVLPGKKPGSHLVGLPKVWSRVRARAALQWATLHILRHSFASLAASRGLGLPIIGKLLGHRDPSTTARYAKVAREPATLAAQSVASHLNELMTGGKS